MHYDKREEKKLAVRNGYVLVRNSWTTLVGTSEGQNRRLPLDGTPVEGIEQLRAIGQGLPRLRIRKPLSRTFVHLRPLCLLLLHGGFEEVVGSFGSLRGELVGSPPFGDEAEVVVDVAYYAGFLPSLAFGGGLGVGFVRFPAALGQHPAVTLGGLNKEHVVLVGRERNNACHQALALGAIT